MTHSRPTGGMSILEVLVALTILAFSLAPVLNLVGTSGQAIQKSQSLGLAVGMAHKIAQHLMAMPYDGIVDSPEIFLADGGDDGIFNPLENPGTGLSTALRIKVAELPELYGFLQKYRFRYQLDVVSDQPKDVKIRILWEEGGRRLEYSLRVYVAKH